MLLLADQITSGMDYLSSRHIVHGDLAARNVLVGAEAHVKISDLGLGRHTYPHEYYAPAGVKTSLPVRWMPPESVSTGIVTSESDIWSLAVTLWEVCSIDSIRILPTVIEHTHTVFTEIFLDWQNNKNSKLLRINEVVFLINLPGVHLTISKY